MIMDLHGQRGFLINSKWRSNTWQTHAGNAMQLIVDNGWYDEWYKSNMIPADFIVKHKGAIQIASEKAPQTIIISKDSYSELLIRNFKKNYNLEDYDVQQI